MRVLVMNRTCGVVVPVTVELRLAPGISRTRRARRTLLFAGENSTRGDRRALGGVDAAESPWWFSTRRVYADRVVRSPDTGQGGSGRALRLFPSHGRTLLKSATGRPEGSAWGSADGIPLNRRPRGFRRTPVLSRSGSPKFRTAGTGEERGTPPAFGGSTAVAAVVRDHTPSPSPLGRSLVQRSLREDRIVKPIDDPGRGATADHGSPDCLRPGPYGPRAGTCSTTCGGPCITCWNVRSSKMISDLRHNGVEYLIAPEP